MGLLVGKTCGKAGSAMAETARLRGCHAIRGEGIEAQLSACASSVDRILQKRGSDDHDTRSLEVTGVLGQPGVANAHVSGLTHYVIAVVAGMVFHESEAPVGAKEGLDGAKCFDASTREPERAADRLLPRQCVYSRGTAGVRSEPVSGARGLPASGTYGTHL